MDSFQSENRDSDDSIQLELSPLNSKATSEAEGPANDISEQSITEKSEESLEEQNGSVERKVELTDSSTVDGTSQEEKDDSGKETPKDAAVTKTDDVKKKKESSLLETNNTSKLNSSVPKNSNASKTAASTVPETKEVKRKRTITSEQRSEVPSDETEAKVKRAKTKSTNDNFCWRCHKESVDANCSACPRSWHRKCMGGAPPTSINENWICGECATILRAENAETRSEVMAHLSIDHLCMLLKYIVERMRSCQGSEPFWKPVDLSEVPNYMDYVVRPMDLDLLESNVRSKLYGSTDAFMADAKWIQHNCIVFNTCGGVYADTSKLTNAAKQIIKTAKQEVAEIEACTDCYVRGRNLPRPHPSWFIEACRKPHPLIWAKLKGFPFWPAKAMPRVNGQGHVDVRFFGQHDRAWVAPKDVYLYSREPPTPLPRKRKVEMAECIKEITRHCRKLEVAFGPFQFAPSKTPYNPQDPMQIKIMLPQYDPLRPSDNSTTPALAARRKSPFRKRATAVKRKLEVDSTLNETADSTANDSAKTGGNVADSTASETSRTKKRQRKLPANSEARTPQEEASSPLVRAPDATSTPTSNDNASRANKTMSNGTPEVKTRAAGSKTATPEPRTSVFDQSKGKSEKPSIPLEKSLAGLLRTVNAKGRLSHPRNSNSKAAASPHAAANSSKTETKANAIKVYKPKARMVDKVNAEKALKSTIEKDQNRHSETAKPAGKIVNGLLNPVTLPGASVAKSATTTISLLHNRRDNNIIIGNSLLKTSPKKLQTRILVVNNGALEAKQLHAASDDTRTRTETPAVRVKQEPNLSPQMTASVQQKQSRAKKSFPNKPPRLPHLLPKLPKLTKPPTTKSLDTMVFIPARGSENGLDYQLPPPEAGPLSAQLHRGANELAKRMGQFLEEAVRKAAESNVNELGDSVESHQATIHSLRLQIERMRWQHQQQLAELKHNTDRTLREMRASLEAERLRAVEEVRKEAEEERTRCVDETKTRQWCAHCGREALFYCCWNTAYCDHLCQQAHWPLHQRKCVHKTSLGSGSADDSGSRQQQQQHQQQQQQGMPPLFGGPRVNWSRSDFDTERSDWDTTNIRKTRRKNDRDCSKGKPPVGRIDVSKLRSACLTPTVTTKRISRFCSGQLRFPVHP